MTRETRREDTNTARRIAETALDVAIGGTALVVDKTIETVDKVVGRGERTARRARKVTRERASEASRTARRAIGEHDRSPYEERTLDELYELAAERDIEGRSTMRKEELIEALREHR